MSLKDKAKTLSELDRWDFTLDKKWVPFEDAEAEISNLEARIEDYDQQLTKVTGWLNAYKEQTNEAQKILNEIPTGIDCNGDTYDIRDDDQFSEWFSQLREALKTDKVRKEKRTHTATNSANRKP